MIIAIDVAYYGPGARAAGVVFEDWRSSSAVHEVVVDLPTVAEYVPGEFYLRELPCIAALLAAIDDDLHCIVIDGYVSLGEPARPGLGAHLWASLKQRVPAIGVAKSSFVGTPVSAEVFRGHSQRPLYVTAAGLPLDVAKQSIVDMHGAYRIPDLLKRADALSRSVTRAHNT